MGHSWGTHEPPMSHLLLDSVGPWVTHAFAVLAHGPSMGHLPVAHEPPLVLVVSGPWVTHAFVVFACGSPTSHPWFGSTGLWVAQGSPVGNPWVYKLIHGSSMIHPWIAHIYEVLAHGSPMP